MAGGAQGLDQGWRGPDRGGYLLRLDADPQPPVELQTPGPSSEPLSPRQ